MTFKLDPRLNDDTKSLTSLELCEVRLMNDATYPWLVLVPRRNGVVEVIDLGQEELKLCWAELEKASKVMKHLYPDCKLNLATLGNVVSQLHFHVIARFESDPSWPGPVWGKGEPKPYDEQSFQAIKTKILDALKTC